MIKYTASFAIMICIGMTFFGGTGCILEPDKEFISDTTIVRDTLKLYDTIDLYHDTLIMFDTVKIHDTTKVINTVTVHDTVKIHDTTKVINTVPVHDTVKIHDTMTLWKHDTLRIHDTIKIHDTAFVHDTLRTFATTTLSADLVGTWSGVVAGQTVRLAISTYVYPFTNYAFSFTANVDTKVYNGYIKSTSGNNTIVDINGPGAYGENANWIFSITNNNIVLQQIGYPMFPTIQVFTLKRIQ